jgi:hypothetical protein
MSVNILKLIYKYYFRELVKKINLNLKKMKTNLLFYAYFQLEIFIKLRPTKINHIIKSTPDRMAMMRSKVSSDGIMIIRTYSAKEIAKAKIPR